MGMLDLDVGGLDLDNDDVANVDDLLSVASEEDILSPDTLDIIKAGNLAADIQAGLGASPDDLLVTDATMIGRLLDDSTSISGIPNGPESVVIGANAYIDAFIAAKIEEGILMGTWTMNADKPVQAFVTMDSVKRLEKGINYRANGVTPLYRKTCTILGTMHVKSVEFMQSGVPCRFILLIVTDGRDEDLYNRDQKFTAAMVAQLIADFGENLIVQFMGIEGNSYVNFREIAKEMGVQDKHVITSGSTPHEIRASFEMASKSAVVASQSANSFSKTNITGFGVS